MSLKDRFSGSLEQAISSPAEQSEKLEVSSPISIDSYLQDFGFTPGREYISPDYIEQFYIAMKLDRYIKDLKISIATEPDNTSPKQLIEREVQKTREKTSYVEGEREAIHPTNSMDLDTITDLNQLPDVLPNEWLLEDIDSDLFLQKATNYALLRPIWTEVTQTPIVSTETVVEKELVEVQAPKMKKKQHAFVLRDISGSTFGLDNRHTMIRGLALAFLRQGYLQGSEMGLRDFEGHAHPLQRGKTQQDLRRLADYLMMYGNGSSTDIEGAIRQAVDDIKQEGKFQRADILLLTDGEASLGRNPLGDIKLHTIMVGEEGANPRLRDWSETFQFLDSAKLPVLLQPKKSEINQTGQSTSQLLEKASHVQTQSDAQELCREVESLQEMIRTMQRHDRKGSQELYDQQELLSDLQRKLGRENRSQLIEENREAQKKKEEEEAKKQAELERAELLRRQAEEEALKRLIEELAQKSQSQKLTPPKTSPESSDQNTSSQGSGDGRISPQGDIDPLSLFRYLSRKVKSGMRWSVEKTKKLDETIKHALKGGETDES